MKYRTYKVMTFAATGVPSGDSAVGMQEFLDHINKYNEKIMHIIPIGDMGVFVNIITLGQDNGR